MARFHPLDGQFLSGNGAAVSVNGTVLHPRGTCAQWWFDPELGLWTAIAQISDDHGATWRVASYRHGAWHTILPHGANEIEAASDRYLAMWVGQPFANFPLPPGAVIVPTHAEGRAYGAPDGTIAMRPGPESPGLLLVRTDGSVFSVPGVNFAPENVDVLSRDKVTCDDNRGGVIGFGMTLGELLPGVARMRYRVAVGGVPWVTYYTSVYDLYVSHPVNDLEHGRVIEGPCYHFDVGFRGGRLTFGASRGIQELPHENLLLDIVHDLPERNLRELGPTQPTEPIPVIGRDCYVCWFEHAPWPQYPPGNATLAAAAGLPNLGMLIDVHGRTFAQFVMGDTVAEINAQVAALPSDESAYAYWDDYRWPDWPTLRPQDYLSIRAYCQKGLPIHDFETELRQQIALAPAGPHLALTCQCYTSNLTLTADIGALVPVFARLAKDVPRIRLLAVFMDCGRANSGLAGHPDVLPRWQELFAGVTGIPESGESPVLHQMPSDVYDVITRMHERYAQECIDLHPGNTEEQAREMTGRMVAQVKYSFPNQGWTWKIAGHGRPPSKDNIGWLHQGSFTGYDLYLAAGANGPKHLNAYPPPNFDLAGQIPIDEPEPKNWLEEQPQPGSLNVLILDYDKVVRRSDPNGMLIRFEVESDQPVTDISLDLVEDGEPGIPLKFSTARSQDGRYVRALAFKPTVNGERFTLRVTAKDAGGRTGSADGPVPVTVTL